MRKKILFGTLLLLVFSANMMIKPSSSVDTLTGNDFKLQSFSKTIDFFDFARNNPDPSKPIPDKLHAYLYQTYINVSGFQLYYSGLINITTDENTWLTIPVQSFIEHYKTPAGKNVLTSSSFIMLLAFNDTDNSKHADSPDINDNLYASFSLGLSVDVANITGNKSKPALSSKTEIIPLTHSADNMTWEWGMRYTNLTAVWWRIFTDPLDPRYELLPIAITTYEELTFTYKLELDPTNHTAKLTSNYVIGRMTNLWLIVWVPIIFIPVPIVTHFNSTGAYYVNGTRIPNGPTIYQFLESQHIKMSLVLFQNSFVLKQATKSTVNDSALTEDAEEDVSNGEIVTEAGNERIFKSDFGTKNQYKLYNSTAGGIGATAKNYTAVTRTVPRAGYARNHLFDIHVALLKYLPLIVKHIDPQLYQEAKDRMLNMTYADYFYVISYPTYSGFKIEHDPTYTAYIAAPTAGLPNLFGLIVIGAIVAVAVIGAVFVLRRRRSQTQSI